MKCLFVIAFLALVSLPAQSIPSLPSLPDGAESKAESVAFAAMSQAQDPAQKRSLALSFVARYPASWLLSTAWQLAAAASVDLNDNAGVIANGRQSLAIRPDNPLLLIAVARAEYLLGDHTKAQREARDALLWLSVLTPAAGATTQRSLEDYARRLAGLPEAPPPPRASKQSFAGSASCRPCHSAIFEAWSETGMAKMLRPRTSARLLADFSKLAEFRNPSGDVEARIGGDSTPFFEVRTPAGKWQRYPVDYAIGSKWQQAYATSLPDGRFFVFPLQYSTITKEWLNYWRIIDPPESKRARTDQFSALTEDTSYQRNCAVCHTSQLALKTADPTMERAAFREPGVNCEMCHGPSAGHVAETTSGTKSQHTAAEPPFRFGSLDHVEATLVCGQCHRQSAVRNRGDDGEMNFTTEPPFYPRLTAKPSAELGRRAVYKDGRFRETTFIGEAFMRSACFLRGTAQCASCHDPHPANAQTGPASLKFAGDPDHLCLQCHAALAQNSEAHTHHARESPGSRCTACHMPPIMNALLFRAASHQISDIPRADTLARFGPQESPNACLICHKDKDVNWLTLQLSRWRKP